MTAIVVINDSGGIRTIVNPAAIGTGIPLQVSTFTLTNDQIKAAPGLPPPPRVEIVPAPSNSQYILPILVVARQDFTNGIYTNIQTGTVFADIGYIDGNNFYSRSASPLDVEDLMADDSQEYDWIIGTPSGIYDPAKTGKALGFTISNSLQDFTGGSAANTLKGVVYYMVVDVS